MENNDPKRKEDVRDPIGSIGWPKEKGRDGERTPMQWDAGAQRGIQYGQDHVAARGAGLRDAKCGGRGEGPEFAC